MASLSSKLEEDEISGINVTPLVDVVLVLLVIFMITAPALYKNAISVQLPKATTGQGAASKTHLEIYIDRAGAIHISGKTYDEKGFSEFLKAQKPASAMILADKKAEHGHVIGVVDTLKSQGVEKFSFGVEKAK